MARQASELRPAVPFVGLERFGDALDAIEFRVSVDDQVVDSSGSRTIQLERDRFLTADCRLLLERDAIVRSVERAARDANLPQDAVSLLCFATSVTLKQTELVHPDRSGGRVLLAPIGGADGLPSEIVIDRHSNRRLFHDVSSGFRLTYGFVLGRDVDTTNALTPRWRGTWLAYRISRVQVERERTGSYEIHELTDERRLAFGLRGRPLYYVHQIDDAASPLDAQYLDEFVEIYVDEDVLPLLRSERPGAATRYVASQIAGQLYATVLEVGARDLAEGDDVQTGCLFGKALAFLSRAADAPSGADVRAWVESDPGRLPAWVQSRIDQASAAEALLAS